jgi:hypothetical protein
LSTTTVSETNQWCAKYVPIGSPHVTPYVSHIFCPKVYTCLYVSHILCPKVFFSSSSWFISFPFRSLYVSHILCPKVFFFLLPGLFPSHSVPTVRTERSQGKELPSFTLCYDITLSSLSTKKWEILDFTLSFSGSPALSNASWPIHTYQTSSTINKDISPLTLSFLGSSTLSNCHAKHPGDIVHSKRREIFVPFTWSFLGWLSFRRRKKKKRDSTFHPEFLQVILSCQKERFHLRAWVSSGQLLFSNACKSTLKMSFGNGERFHLSPWVYQGQLLFQVP